MDRRNSLQVRLNLKLLSRGRQLKFSVSSKTDQLHQIFNTSLSSIICRNTDHVDYSQRYVMKRVSKTNPMEKCTELDTFSFEPWREAHHEMSKVSVADNESRVSSIKT